MGGCTVNNLDLDLDSAKRDGFAVAETGPTSQVIISRSKSCRASYFHNLDLYILLHVASFPRNRESWNFFYQNALKKVFIVHF